MDVLPPILYVFFFFFFFFFFEERARVRDQNTLVQVRGRGHGAKSRSGVRCYIAVCAPSNEQTNDVWRAITASPHLLHVSADGATLKNTLHVWLNVCRGRAQWTTESFSCQFRESRSRVTMETVQVCFCLDFSKTCHYKGWNFSHSARSGEKNTFWIQSSCMFLTCLCFLAGQRRLWEGGWSHRDGSHHLGGEDERLQDWCVRTEQGGKGRLLQLGRLHVERSLWPRTVMLSVKIYDEWNFKLMAKMLNKWTLIKWLTYTINPPQRRPNRHLKCLVSSPAITMSHICMMYT